MFGPVTNFARFASVTLAALSLALLRSSPALAADEKDDEASGEASATGEKSEAKPAESEAKKDEPKKDDDPFGHGGQFGLRAGVVLGYRMVLRYNDQSPYCTAPNPSKAVSDQQKFCGYGAPVAGDFGLSYGVLDWVEPFIWGRFGFAADTHSDTNPLMLAGAGLRLYTMSDAAFKIFVEPAVALEFEKSHGTPAWQTNTPKYGTDFVFHLAAGPQIDFHHNFGVYATAGVSVSVVRALASSLDLNIGVQARYP
jgi:opacity protein-like surface antigen